MKTSTRAALYSSLVFPGAGYFIVNCKIRGVLISGISLISFLWLFYDIFSRAHIIASKIISGEIPNDIFVVAQHVKTMLHSPDSGLTAKLTLVIISLWVVSTLDAYRLGKPLD